MMLHTGSNTYRLKQLSCKSDTSRLLVGWSFVIISHAINYQIPNFPKHWAPSILTGSTHVRFHLLPHTRPFCWPAKIPTASMDSTIWVFPKIWRFQRFVFFPLFSVSTSHQHLVVPKSGQKPWPTWLTHVIFTSKSIGLLPERMLHSYTKMYLKGPAQTEDFGDNHGSTMWEKNLKKIFITHHYNRIAEVSSWDHGEILMNEPGWGPLQP